MKKSELRSAYQELITVLGLVDDDKQPLVIEDDITIEDLEKGFKEASDYINPKEDELTEETILVVEEYNPKMAKAVRDAVAARSGEGGTASKDDDLVTQIKTAKGIDGMKELKDIAKTNPEFKSIRDRLNSYKTLDVLRKAMLELVKEKAPADKEETSKPKAEEVKKKKTSPKVSKDAEKTKFGHVVGSQAGNIDECLLKNEGKSIDLQKIAKEAGVKSGRVKAHLVHLIQKKKLNIDLKKAKDGSTLVEYNG